jgi:hypothetical protein
MINEKVGGGVIISPFFVAIIQHSTVGEMKRSFQALTGAEFKIALENCIRHQVFLSEGG